MNTVHCAVRLIGKDDRARVGVEHGLGASNFRVDKNSTKAAKATELSTDKAMEKPWASSARRSINWPKWPSAPNALNNSAPKSAGFGKIQ